MKVLSKVLLALALGSASAGVVFPAALGFGDWSVVEGALPRDMDVTFRVALSPKIPGAVEATLARVATPGSPDFRKYLSAAEINALAAPDAADAARAVAWLKAKGGTVIETNSAGDWVTISAPVAAVEAMFRTTLSRFINKRDPTRTRVSSPAQRAISRSSHNHIHTCAHVISSYPIWLSSSSFCFSSSK